MIYVVISNIGLAIMMIVVYARYSKLRISSAAEILQLHKKIDHTVEERRESENKMLQDNRDDSRKIESLLREIDELRKEKESEFKLRLEAEKQIALAIQKTEDVRNQMHDWALAQDATIADSKESIIKIGNELYRKLNENFSHETEVNKNILGKFSKNITGVFDKTLQEKLARFADKPKTTTEQKTDDKKSTSNEKEKSSTIVKTSDPTSQKIINNIIELMNTNGQTANKDYFTATNFDATKAKLFHCELAIISLDRLYILDLKACHYFKEYHDSKNKESAAITLKQKLNKYFTYLANSKYRSAILTALKSSQAKFEGSDIAIILLTKADIDLLKKLKLFEKGKKVAHDIMDADEISNLIL